MIFVYTDEFKKQFRKLPKRIQKAYCSQESIMKENLFDPRLHAKPLQGNDGIFSFRVTQHYRVLFRISDDVIVICLTIRHRKDVYR